MAHNANQALLGAIGTNIYESGNRVGAIDAGLAVRLKSDGTITTAKADGLLLGISIGKDLSDTNKTAICYKGVRVPIRLTAAFTPTIGAVVYISDTTGKAAASATDATAVNAVYTQLLTDGALPEDGGTAVAACYIDFPGGL